MGLSSLAVMGNSLTLQLDGRSSKQASTAKLSSETAQQPAQLIPPEQLTNSAARANS